MINNNFKKDTEMKKILLAIAIVLTLGLGANAQRDGFIGNEGISGDRDMSNPEGLLQMPTQGIGTESNEPAPLGTGLLIMTALGGAYMLRKRK
jgi:hypothetical protein